MGPIAACRAASESAVLVPGGPRPKLHSAAVWLLLNVPQRSKQMYTASGSLVSRCCQSAAVRHVLQVPPRTLQAADRVKEALRTAQLPAQHACIASRTPTAAHRRRHRSPPAAGLDEGQALAGAISVRQALGASN